MSGQRDIVQRLVRGELTADEKRGVHEGTKRWDTDDMEPLEPRKVRFGLRQDQKVAVYEDVKQRIVAGATPDDIGKAVVACMEEHLKEKEEEAYGGEAEKEFTNQRTGKKGGFKRVE
jgi:hypothetical protein